MVLKKALFSILVFLASWQLSVEAQQITHIVNGGLKMGFGLGSSYQSSDLKNFQGYGMDLFLGTPVSQKDNAFFALDWRFHFVTGVNTAYDHRVEVDGSYTNVMYRHFNYDLELLLTLNRLRERTGIILGGFAGAGLTHALVSADMRDASGMTYDYGSILPGQDRSQILTALDDLTDSDFETRLYNKAALFPTAGAFLGYQFSPSFSLGLEHKMNFSLSERSSFAGMDIDNQVLEGSGLDWNNYTSLVFRFALGGPSGSRAGRSHLDADTYAAEDADPAAALNSYPPQVSIAVPHDDPHITADSLMKVSARVFNISNSNEIQVRLNGQTQDFRFYTSISSVEIYPVLQPGSNMLEISVGNGAGVDRDQVEVIYRKQEEVLPATTPGEGAVAGITEVEEGFPPDVRILFPYDRVTNYNAPYAEVEAEITGVDSPSGISLSVNGIWIEEFSYFPETMRLVAPVPLIEGTNRLSIFARNGHGSDSEDRILVRESMAYIPPVSYINPQPAQSMQPVQPVQKPVYLQEEKQPVIVNPGQVQKLESPALIVDPKQQVSNPARQDVSNPSRREVISDPKNAGSRRGQRPVRSVPGQPVTPAPSDPVSPAPSDPVSPAPSDPVSPAPSDPVSPAPSDPVSPAPSDPVSPAPSDPVSPEPSVPVTPGPPDPVTPEPPANEEPGDSDSEEGWVRINPGNSDWQFCLQSGNTSYNRSDLSNSGFSYSGSASSLYFKPIAGGGTALVNGNPYSLKSGQYYLFTGSIQVEVTNKHKGAMGQWSVYINAGSAPTTGKGKNSPVSPCENAKKKTGK